LGVDDEVGARQLGLQLGVLALQARQGVGLGVDFRSALLAG
jgi:hypothetical protein